MSRGIILEKEKSMEETWENPDELEISAGELDVALKGGAALYDLRGEFSREYGFIPGSAGRTEEQVRQMLDAGELAGRKIVLYCARGEVSLDLAAELRESGIAAGAWPAATSSGCGRRWSASRRRPRRANCRTRWKTACAKSSTKRYGATSPRRSRHYQLVKPGDKHRGVHLRRQGLDADGQAFSGAAAAQQMSLSSWCFSSWIPATAAQNRQRDRGKRADSWAFRSRSLRSRHLLTRSINVEKSPCYLCARMRRGLSVQ